MWAAVWLLLAGLVSPGSASLTVSAAVSLTEALTEVSRAYEESGGGAVRFNFAASNVLARQIVNGAPVDLFISADVAQMDLAERAGAIDPATRVDVLSNRLAVLVRAEAAAPVRDAADLRHAAIRRIAIGNPDAVPAGVYARQFLRDAGVWKDVEKKVVPVGSVRAALAAVDNRSVDAAIVYASDAAHARSAAVGFVVETGGPSIVYPAAVVMRSTRRAEAVRFLAFLNDHRAQTIFLRHRFSALVR